jgi:hypothetical protein
VDVVVILRLAAIDAEVSRLLSLLRGVVSLLECRRADLRALGVRIDDDCGRLQAAKDGSSRIVERPRKQLHRNERACAELARTLERDQASAQKMSAAWRRLLEGGQIVPCSGCMRLLHDPGCVERDFMPPTLRPVSKAPS